MRRAIDTAFRERSTITVPDLELNQQVEGTGRYINLTIMIMQVEQGAPELAVITVMDITETVQMKRRLEAVQREQADMVGELSAANKRFSAMNKELQDANEELQAANEELMLTQEELQATNEELQTTNDELSARTVELQEVMKQYRTQQLQLSQLLERFPHFVMVVNADDLTVQTINASYKQLLGNRDVAGLPVTELFSGDDMDQLTRTLKKAVRERQTIYTQPIHAGVADGTLYRLVHTVVPISDETGNNLTRLFIYSEKPE